jgi:hypothetical protein
MTWHVVCLGGTQDVFAPPDQGDGVIEVPFDSPGHPAALQSSIAEVFAQLGRRPSSAAADLLRAAIGAYTADLRISRDTGYDRWTRDIVLYLPVEERTRWAAATTILEQLLAFLSGDRWTIELRPTNARYRPNQLPPGKRVKRSALPASRAVSLFSGGLDSYIGAIDLLEKDERAIFVGHHAAGLGPTSVSQESAHTVLRSTYGLRRAPLLQFWVTPPVGYAGNSETTTRSRSILFLALGIAVVDALNAQELVVPENGLISLNVPLTPSRMGSFSTRTTHPYLMALLRDLLKALQLDFKVELPYRFATKGEMMANCANQEVLMRGLDKTMSCSHPGVGRWSGSSPNQHCGRCLPCLIRRAAITATRTDPTIYTWQGWSQSLSEVEGGDLRAVGIALDRYSRESPGLHDVLVPGPLPGTDEELLAYLGVFQRGINELRRFLGSDTLRRGQQ